MYTKKSNPFVIKLIGVLQDMQIYVYMKQVAKELRLWVDNN